MYFPERILTYCVYCRIFLSFSASSPGSASGSVGEIHEIWGGLDVFELVIDALMRIFDFFHQDF